MSSVLQHLIALPATAAGSSDGGASVSVTGSGSPWSSSRSAEAQRSMVRASALLRCVGETSTLSHTEAATFGGRFEREGQGGTNTLLLVQRDSTSAVQAGRSKAKKFGGTGGGRGGPGGRIERRPPPPDKVPRQRTGSSTTDEKDGSKNRESGTGAGAGVQGGSNQSGAKVGNTRRRQGNDDEDYDISWLLEEDSQSSSENERRTKLVGGWGRDKSMQREVPIGSDPKLRGAKSGKRESSTTGQKRTSGKLPPLPIDDPTVRYPDEDYVNGPFGPYAWRGVCIGKPIEGNFSTTQVVFFSNVVDEEDKEDREQYNYTVEYTQKLDKLNEDIGIVYYYVFAGSKYRPKQEPWRDWTLVAQLAVESGEELDQRVLFSRLNPNIQDIMLKCVAWGRPDLIYVRKPRLQLRLEAQDNFMSKLLHILNQPDTLDSYYGKLCQILRVHPTSSSEEVKAAYEALSEEGKLECVGYLLTQHPVKLLASARYDRIVKGVNDQNSVMTELDFSGVELSMDTTAPAENGNDDRDIESMNALSHEQQDSAEGRRGEEVEQVNTSLAIQIYNRKNRYEPEPGPTLRSAVRPFYYSHLVEEIATIHNILHGSDSSTEWVREAVNSR